MSFFFFFNDTATTEIYTLSLHDALPIYGAGVGGDAVEHRGVPLATAIAVGEGPEHGAHGGDRKSTRLNSSHLVISYAVFCLKKKKGLDHIHLAGLLRGGTAGAHGLRDGP